MASERAQILITAIDQTKAALASVKSGLEGLASAAGKINGVLAGLGAALSIAGLVAAGKAALDTADELSKLSQKTGLSVESLSLLKPVAEQSGVSLEGLTKGLAKLAVTMVDAAVAARNRWRPLLAWVCPSMMQPASCGPPRTSCWNWPTPSPPCRMEPRSRRWR